MVIAFKHEPSRLRRPKPVRPVELKTAVEPTPVTPLPRQSKQLPLWLKLLVIAQQGSTVIAGGLMAAALMVYSWTVYVDKMVFRTSRELEALKAETQQITTTNETLKHSLAERAATSASGFRDHRPDQAVFLVPAPLRAVESEPEAEIEADMPRPLGY
ncbi:MAG: hypothetical protein AAFU71_04055 [Cyanobacteria bacterium J06632_22]